MAERGARCAMAAASENAERWVKVNGSEAVVPPPRSLPEQGRSESAREDWRALVEVAEREWNQRLGPTRRVITALTEIHVNGFDPRSPLHSPTRRNHVQNVPLVLEVGHTGQPVGRPC